MENIYTFIGQDTSYNLNNINNKIAELGIANSTIIKFDYEESNINKLCEELNTISLFVENKIVILYNASFLLENDISAYQSFLKYILNPNPTTFLFISVPQLDKLNPEFKEALSKNSICIKSDVLTSDDFAQYVKNKVKINGYNISEDALFELIKRSNEDYNLLNSNLDKLLIYKYESKNISLNDIKIMITRDLDSNVFDLVDAYISKNKQKTYDLYMDLKASNVDDTSLLGSLIYKFREMALVKKMTESGATKADISSAFNVKEGRAYYMIKNVTGYSLSDLKERLNDLLDLDYKSKVGLVELDKALLTYLIK